jgi:hypothetical protein
MDFKFDSTNKRHRVAVFWAVLLLPFGVFALIDPREAWEALNVGLVVAFLWGYFIWAPMRIRKLCKSLERRMSSAIMLSPVLPLLILMVEAFASARTANFIGLIFIFVMVLNGCYLIIFSVAFPIYTMITKRRNAGVADCVLAGFLIGGISPVALLILGAVDRLFHYSGRGMPHDNLAYVLDTGALGAGIGFMFWLIAPIKTLPK